MLGREDLLLRPPGAAPLLAPQLGYALRCGALRAEHGTLDFVGQKLSGAKAVERLRAFPLAFDHRACGSMQQDNTGGNLVDVLPAVSARTDKLLVEILLADAQTLKAFAQQARLGRRDRKHTPGIEPFRRDVATGAPR